MEKTKELPVKLSIEANIDIDNIYQYGLEVFGLKQTKLYEDEIWQLVDFLSNNYLLFPECRFLTTKAKLYRWIILDAHYVIYRITTKRIEVLRVMSSRMSITEIKRTRRIRPS
ncbi:MAG: type II toxin-antitoxin system RelE/ParE family toxin [Prolixibacteraceae bacterium]|nr:type II toxin-antitoxin system RelE/ParE family toxin [Prolixibacteraceae bacterium]